MWATPNTFSPSKACGPNWTTGASSFAFPLRLDIFSLKNWWKIKIRKTRWKQAAWKEQETETVWKCACCCVRVRHQLDKPGLQHEVSRRGFAWNKQFYFNFARTPSNKWNSRQSFPSQRIQFFLWHLFSKLAIRRWQIIFIFSSNQLCSVFMEIFLNKLYNFVSLGKWLVFVVWPKWELKLTASCLRFLVNWADRLTLMMFHND